MLATPDWRRVTGWHGPLLGSSPSARPVVSLERDCALAASGMAASIGPSGEKPGRLAECMRAAEEAFA